MTMRTDRRRLSTFRKRQGIFPLSFLFCPIPGGFAYLYSFTNPSASVQLLQLPSAVGAPVFMKHTH